MLGEELIQSVTSAAGGGSNEPAIFAGGCRTVCMYLFSSIEAQSELICVIKPSDFRHVFIDPDQRADRSLRTTLFTHPFLHTPRVFLLVFFKLKTDHGQFFFSCSGTFHDSLQSCCSAL